MRLLAALVNVAAWPLAKLAAAWDAADQKLAETYANGREGDDA